MRKRLGMLVAIMVMVLSLSGCQKTDKIEQVQEQNAQLVVEEAVIEEPVKNPVTIAFTGDVLFSDGVLSAYDNGGLTGILDQNLIDELNQADITVINNEFPFSERGTQAEDKQYTFRVSPDRVHILQEMGVDIASLANNHSLDFGIEAMLDSIDTLSGAGIVPLGAGKNSTEAKQIAYLEREGRIFAFLGASRVIPVADWTAGKNPGLLTTYDPTMLLEQILEAESKADYVIVYVHWGLERESYPEDYQRTLGQMYIDAGADLVVGSHSHCLQGIEYYNDVPIVYSLGNFVFGSQIPTTALLKVSFEEGEEPVLSVVPATGVDFYTYTITEESDLKEFYSFYEEISFGVGFEDGVVVRKE